MFGRPPVPKRALLAATLGAAYAILVVLPAPGTVLGVSWPGISWFVLSVALLFVIPLAYHAFTFWAILWMVYRGVSFVRSPGDPLLLAIDVGVSLAALALLFTSGYMRVARSTLQD